VDHPGDGNFAEALFAEVQQMRPTNPTSARDDEPALIPYRADRLAISVSEASAALGCSVSTVYRMIRSGHLGSARSTASGRIFVNLQSVRDFVEGEAHGAAMRASERIRQLG
jgi:excisionase family DNA binding protein